MTSKQKWLFVTTALVIIAVTNTSCIGVEQTVTLPDDLEQPATVTEAVAEPTQVTPAPTESPSSDLTLAKTAESDPEDAPHGKPNRLIDEKSPYLLQHAYNPVDWYPWGEEAFAKARAENKPIFLSIGYSTCHWCHVMEAESFEDPEVAALMNDAFISIKVDREERPDIDSLYMNVAMMMNGSGGWPLNIIMTPDQKPFYAATYIPKTSRFQLVGMMELIPRVQEVWKTQHIETLDFAERVAEAVQLSAQVSTDEALTEATLDGAYEDLTARFDADNGGFGEAPKFPSPHNLLFLLRYWKRTGDANALTMVEITLQEMRQGGIYDQVGFGFHRYSTDAHWLLPHFEKMLYDQAMLAMTYTEAYQATGNPEYEQSAREIFSYVLRDMTDPDGGFYSAEDADSEGEEGKFYLWSTAELQELLTPEELALAKAVYSLENEGNFVEQGAGERTGANILHRTGSYAQVAEELGMSEVALGLQIEPIRQKLFTTREARIHPHKDDKVLTDWNGLMIAALAKGAQAFDEPTYAEAAARSADFLLSTLRDGDGRLLHRYRDGEAGIQATADDYAFLIWGLLDLYEATFELPYLEQAIALNGEFITHFWDDESGGFFFTADDAEALLTRQKEFYDGAIPSANSVAMLNLLRLERITADSDLAERAAAIGLAFGGGVQANPAGFTQMLVGVDFGTGPSHEVVIVGEPGETDTMTLVTALHRPFVPNKVVLLRPPGDAPPITQLAQYTQYHYALDGKATAYVCQNFECELPTTDVETMLALLEGASVP